MNKISLDIIDSGPQSKWSQNDALLNTGD